MSTLSKSPSLSPAMPGHRNIQPWLVFYVGTWNLNLGLYPLSISQAPESAFLVHYSIIFLKTLVNRAGRGHTQVPVVWRCPKNMLCILTYIWLVLSGLWGCCTDLCVAEDWVKMGLWRKLGLVFIKHFKPHKVSERPLCHSDLQWPQGPLPGKQGSFCPCSLGSP